MSTTVSPPAAKAVESLEQALLGELIDPENLFRIDQNIAPARAAGNGERSVRP